MEQRREVVEGLATHLSLLMAQVLILMAQLVILMAAWNLTGRIQAYLNPR